VEEELSVSAADPASPEVSQGLQKWLSGRLEGGEKLVISGISKPSSGFSAQTWLIDLADAESGEHHKRVVARVETADPAVYPRQSPDHPDNPAGDVEVALQYEVMKSLHKAGTIPLAGLIGYEPDPALLGQPFFVMDFVGGDVPKESPPYPTEGFFTELDPAGRSQMLRNGLQVMADVHAVPWREVGLEWLVAPGRSPSMDTQVDIWKSFGVDELQGRVHPSLETAWNLLAERTPIASAPALSWGDARPGNMIWQNGKVAAITDFEAAAIAPPELDLGWWLLFDRTMHEAVGSTSRLPGDLTRDEQCDYYARITGRDVSDIRWYETFAAARYCVIVVRVMNRAVARGLMPEDQKIWLENPASEALDQILAS
jgi:aminoglycoside phosphotransferase (APT) family kinase protein